MQLFISRANSSNQTHIVEIDDHKTVKDLKQKVQDFEGVPIDDQILVSRGTPLKDEKTLFEYGISTLSTIQLLLRLRGGGFVKVIDRTNDPNIIFTIVIEHNSMTKYIDVCNFHLSCGSTNIKEWRQKELGGAIFYGEKEINSRRMKPGYVYIKAVDEIVTCGSSEGQIHGNLVRSLLNLEPSQLPADFPTSGFGRRKSGQWKFNSVTLNTGGIGQNDQKGMNTTEQAKLEKFLQIEKYLGQILEVYLSAAIQMWERGQAQNITKQTLVQHFIDPTPVPLSSSLSTTPAPTPAHPLETFRKWICSQGGRGQNFRSRSGWPPAIPPPPFQTPSNQPQFVQSSSSHSSQGASSSTYVDKNYLAQLLQRGGKVSNLQSTGFNSMEVWINNLDLELENIYIEGNGFLVLRGQYTQGKENNRVTIRKCNFDKVGLALIGFDQIFINGSTVSNAKSTMVNKVTYRAGFHIFGQNDKLSIENCSSNSNNGSGYYIVGMYPGSVINIGHSYANQNYGDGFHCGNRVNVKNSTINNNGGKGIRMRDGSVDSCTAMGNTDNDIHAEGFVQVTNSKYGRIKGCRVV
eukprot:TRINITY_DN14_c0_g1_i8.p1 TRINITY_DN14_c0_g1~~TRINITY_DN14_c0_g1_i8.p1  ORF type:complete len:575 (+),score=36.25 TRINITY_DN14_c0_g1_i8:109-1833(+)